MSLANCYYTNSVRSEKRCSEAYLEKTDFPSLLKSNLLLTRFLKLFPEIVYFKYRSIYYALHRFLLLCTIFMVLFLAPHSWYIWRSSLSLVIPLYLWGYISRPQWMPETLDTMGPYVFLVFSCTHIPLIKFNWQIRHSKRLTTVTNNK